MAIIGRIRKRGGLITIIIGIALAAFVLSDFWRKSSKGGRTNNIGEISGEKVTYLDFEKKVDTQLDLLKQESGEENPTADRVFQIREQIWKTMLRDIILGKEYDELGLAVSSDELWDLVQGKEPHQYIIQAFTDPQTGAFNPIQVRNYLAKLDTIEQISPGSKARWDNLEQSIKSDRLFTKYLNLIKGGYYVPKALAKMDYEQKNKKAVFRYFADKYVNIPDNKVTVTDEDYQKYYDAHKQEYELFEPSRDIEYVIFDVLPSDSDKKKVDDDVKEIMAEIEKQSNEDMANFVSKNSDAKYDSTYYKKGKLPVTIDSLVFKAKKGDIIGPLYSDYVYTIAKVMDFQERPDSMKASHIMVSYKGATRAPETVTRTKEQAKAVADSLLKIIKKNAKQFDTLATKFSDDATAAKKAGDLDWFADLDMGGNMIAAFTQACVDGKVGDIKVIETEFGYHVIKITGKKKMEKKAMVAVITRKVEPSNETFQNVYSKASAFAGENSTAEQFNKAVVAKKLNKRLAEEVGEMSNTIAGLEAPREIIRWAYDKDTKKGDVSKVFDLQGMYVVACLKEVKEKGIPPLEQVKTQMEPYVKREKKAETIIKKINALKTPGITLDQLAQKVDSAVVDTLDFVSFATYSLPAFGPEPAIIGTLFTLKKGVMSDPLEGKAGVFVIQVDEFKEAPVVTDYTINKNQLIMTFKSRVSYDVYNALERKADVEDNRLLFY